MSPTYVTLISSDGFEFIVLREAACVAGTIKKMLDPQSEYKAKAPPLLVLNREQNSLLMDIAC